MTDICFTPREAGLARALASKFGFLVEEWFVKPDYCLSKGSCQEFLTIPGSLDQIDFFDVNAGTTRCRYMAAFIKLHNPNVDEILIATSCEIKKGEDGKGTFPVPDVITHDDPARLEFYELKPNSDSGKEAGREKIENFRIICQLHNLPYDVGRLYDPDRRILIWDGTWFGSPSKVRLHFFREEPALLVYEICVEVSGDLLAEVLVKALIKMAALALILVLLQQGGGVLVLASAITSPLQEIVGDGESNNETDVRYVQNLLNDWRGFNNFSLITIDGQVTDETIIAIQDFQQTLGIEPDGRVEPGSLTLSSLEQTHLDNAVEGIQRAEFPDQPSEQLFFAMDQLEPDSVDQTDDEMVDLQTALEEALQNYFTDLYAEAIIA